MNTAQRATVSPEKLGNSPDVITVRDGRPDWTTEREYVACQCPDTVFTATVRRALISGQGHTLPHSVRASVVRAVMSATRCAYVTDTHTYRLGAVQAACSVNAMLMWPICNKEITSAA